MVLSRRAQSILEYTMLIGILTVVLMYMGTAIRRGVQSLVKVTADQIGNQQNADQDFNDTQQGFMLATNDAEQVINNKQTTEIGYIPASGIPVYLSNTSFNDTTEMMTNTITNGGFVPSI